MRLVPLIVFGFVAFATGCGDDSKPGSDASSDTTSDTTSDVGGDAADAADTGSPGDAADTGGGDTSEPKTAILERPSSDDFTCSEGVAPTQPSVKDWQPAAAVAVGDAVWALQFGQSNVYFGKIESDGSLGTRHDLGATSWSVGAADAVADGPSVTLVWAEYTDGGQTVRHAVVDTAKGVTTAAHELFTVGGIGAISLVANGATLAAAWSEQNGEGASKVRFARLDADGIDGEIVDVIDGGQSYAGLASAMVAYKTGFALSWSQALPDDLATYERWFVRLDSAGKKVGEPLRISPAATTGGTSYGEPWDGGGHPMLVVGDDVWVAYTHNFYNNDFSNPEGATTLHIAIVDPDGDVRDEPFNPTVINVNQGQASLFAFGGAVGVAWTGGTAIYICGGCYVDYDLQIALVDPTTLELAADKLTHTHNDHGYNRPRIAVVGDDIYTLAWHDFHALGFPAIARASCVAK